GGRRASTHGPVERHQSMSGGNAVELSGVTKIFGEVTALDNISLEIGDGEFFSLLGPSGCGKTTSLRLIAGFEMPTAGEVLIGGRGMGQAPPFQGAVKDGVPKLR